MNVSSMNIAGIGWVHIRRSRQFNNGKLRIELEVPRANDKHVLNKVMNIIAGLSGRVICYNLSSNILEIEIRSRACDYFSWEHPFMKLLQDELKQRFDPFIVLWRVAK